MCDCPHHQDRGVAATGCAERVGLRSGRSGSSAGLSLCDLSPYPTPVLVSVKWLKQILLYNIPPMENDIPENTANS